jgi:hypothetical protein
MGRQRTGLVRHVLPVPRHTSSVSQEGGANTGSTWTAYSNQTGRRGRNGVDEGDSPTQGNHCPGKSDEHRSTFQRKMKTEQTWTEDSLHLGTSWKRPEKDGKAGTKGCTESDDLSQFVLIVVIMIYSARKNVTLRIQTRKKSLSDVYKSVERGEHVKYKP